MILVKAYSASMVLRKQQYIPHDMSGETCQLVEQIPHGNYDPLLKRIDHGPELKDCRIHK